MSEPASRPPHLLTAGVLVIAVAAVFLAGLQVRDDTDPVAVAAAPADTQPTGVITSGSGTSTGTPDQLGFTATLTNRRLTGDAAQAATNRAVRAVTEALEKYGVAAKDISTAGLSLEPRYDRNGVYRRLVGYSSTQRLTVLVRDLAQAGKALGSVTAVAGKAVTISGITLSLSNEDEVVARARAEAVTKSKAAAEALAEAAGRDVSELVYVEEVAPGRYYDSDNWGGASKTLSLAVMEQLSVPISPGQQEFTVTVKVRWSLG